MGKSLGEIAEMEGKHYIDVMLDLSLETDLRTEFLGEGPEFNVDHMSAVYNDSRTRSRACPTVVPNTKFFTGGAWTTDFLAWMVRDEEKITVEEAHYRMSALAAHAAGFKDRGVLREGAPADVLVYDMAELAIDPSGSARPLMTCPAASGAGCSVRTGTGTSW